jgi:hypothetical protein
MNVYQVKGALTDQAPAVVNTYWGSDTAAVYVAWKNESTAKTSPNTIWYSHSTDSVSWSAPAQIKGKGWAAEADLGPSFALEGDGILYAAWKDKGTDQIWYSTTKDGKSWTEQATVPGAKTASAPSLTSNQSSGPVAVAWRASDDSINYTTFPFGISSWGGGGSGAVSGAASDLAPALGSTGWEGPGLLFAWRAKSDHTLWYESVGGASFPRAQVKGSGFTASSSAKPSLPSQTYTFTPFGLAWKGDKDFTIWVSKDFPNTPLTQQKVPGISTDVAPAWAGVGGILAFKAYNLTVDSIPVENNTLWTCTP